MKRYSLYKKTLTIIFSIVSALAFTSCQKDIPPIFKNKNYKTDQPVVMVVGYVWNGVHLVAKSWINGQEVTLSDGTNDALGNSIFISGNNVYIAGKDAGPVYWKNNTEINLPTKYLLRSNYSSANSVFVAGNKVYIAGNDSSKAVYWIDGVEVILDSVSSANSIFVSGKDIYVAGTFGENAVYWKNGVKVYLTNFPPLTVVPIPIAKSIYVSGSNVYAAGLFSFVGGSSPITKYWKNGVEVPPSNTTGAAFSVFVAGNDEYVAGYKIFQNAPYIYHAVYWKNGNEVILPSSATNSYPVSIYVRGNDVYVAGSEYNTDQRPYAVYWKNGVEVKLTDGTMNAEATSIFVK